uniref:Histone-lysine N-methyltransferase n=1 Tax=Dendroctonus ponderosae TaxID=77166 RepID=A0AAR5P0M7_DENPD
MKNGSSSEDIETTAKDAIHELDVQNRTECDDLPRLVRGDLEGTVDYDKKCLLIANSSTSQGEELPVDNNQDECPILSLITDDSALETSLTDEKARISPIQVRKSKRTFKPVDKLDMLELERKFTPIKKETIAVDDEQSLDNMPLPDRLLLDAEYGDSVDKVCENGSKSSSDLTSSNLYSFGYQVKLHKQNNLFHGIKNVKVCDHCFRQGELYKCKGKCGGSFHIKCLSDVGRQRATTGSMARRSKSAGSKQKSKVRHACEPRVLRSRRKSQCEIVTVKPKYVVGLPNRDSLPGNFHNLSLTDQIDYSMQQVMRQSEHFSTYIDLSDSGSDVEFVSQTTETLDVSESSENLSGINVAHITADSIILAEEADESSALKCRHCRLSKDPPCFSCSSEVNKRGEIARRKCSLFRCRRYYHMNCLKAWPQTQWSIGKWSKIQLLEDDFTCPAHRCHTCFSEELGSSASCRLPGDKLARCLLCPSAFHATTFCTPAGSEILGGAQIICPKHKPRSVQPINTGWCFICSEGGNLVCCDTCPTSVHPECQPVNFTDDDKYVCEDCESGRFPLYDEVVWVKLGQYRWWPALILFPNEVPLNVRLLKHKRGDFVVRFFGTNDHYWVNKARSFLFQEGDSEGGPSKPCKSKNKVYLSYTKAIQDAEIAYRLKKEFKLRQEAEGIDSLKPPAYIRINKSKPVGNVKCGELDLSNATACECNPQKPLPCGADSNCINRLLMTECDPNICRAGIRCRNQAFQKREYSSIAPYKTQGRGWGLKALSSIKQGRFIIEYVGELIDSEEYQRRIRKMHEKKEDNYYFMTVDSDRVIDAGPKGNLSRFMNHSCDPNCVTQKWTVLGETRVGLFAKCDIDAGSELTFNYNFEVVGQEKKVCKCGAKACSGFIGGKVKLEKPRDSSNAALVPKKRKSTQRQSKSAAPIEVWVPPCFVCGGRDSNITCNSNLCQKSYHLRCLDLQTMPKGEKYTCPRHNCKVCFHRTNRCCVLCLNSYCAYHANGHIRYDRLMGFVCYDHDPMNLPKTSQNRRSTRRKSEAESRSPNSDDEVSEDDLSLLERLNRSKRN